MSVTVIDLLRDTLEVHIQGWWRFWTFRRHISVPYASIMSVTHDARTAGNGPVGLRSPGTNLPGLILGGTYRKFWGDEHRTEFWARRQADKCITLNVWGHHFDALVIEVDDPEWEVRQIREVLRDRGFPDAANA